MKRILLLVIFLVSTISNSQVPFPHISNSTFNAERVAKFGVIDVSTDFLEITNSTQFDNSFIPSIWAHQQTDNRFVLRHFATTTSSFDNGTNPIMIFRTEIRNNLNYAAPDGGSFPWGTTASNVMNRPLFSWENGNTQLVRILANGNFGIATTAPTAVLHTVGTVRFENLPSTVINPYFLTTDGNGNVSRRILSSVGGGSTIDCTTTNFIIKRGATDFTCSQIFDDGTGVGIGTTNPTSLFHTNGTLRFENLLDATSPFKLLGTDTAGNVFEYDPSEIPGGSASADYDWLRPDGTFATSITDNIYTNGNVGINVTNPVANLHTNGTLRFEGIADATVPTKILGTDATGNVFEYSPIEVAGGPGSSDYDWIKPDGSLASSIDDDIYTNGNVGINVTNPAANLHTNGTVRFENIADATTPVKILGTDAAGNVLEYNPTEIGGGSGSSDFDWLRPDGGFPSSINDNIYTNGKVAINTSVFPTMVGDVNVSNYGLFVTGGILTEEVRVALTSEWADYVFAKDYTLEPLESVEQFINENGHLKNIPSAKEVAANGIEIGEMNKLLLLKIEELTLYMIELNKKLELQQSEIEILKLK